MKCCFHPYLPGDQRQNGQRQKKLKCASKKYRCAIFAQWCICAENDQFWMKGKISIYAQCDHSPRH